MAGWSEQTKTKMTIRRLIFRKNQPGEVTIYGREAFFDWIGWGFDDELLTFNAFLSNPANKVTITRGKHTRSRWLGGPEINIPEITTRPHWRLGVKGNAAIPGTPIVVKRLKSFGALGSEPGDQATFNVDGAFSDFVDKVMSDRPTFDVQLFNTRGRQLSQRIEGIIGTVLPT